MFEETACAGATRLVLTVSMSATVSAEGRTPKESDMWFLNRS
jgi:hypothetical protein